jgi:hypothetical protein
LPAGNPFDAGQAACTSYRFFEQITSSAHLLTIPDREIQQRYPTFVSKAKIPTLSNIRKAVAGLGRTIEKEKRKGRSTSVY